MGQKISISCCCRGPQCRVCWNWTCWVIWSSPRLLFHEVSESTRSLHFCLRGQFCLNDEWKTQLIEGARFESQVGCQGSRAHVQLRWSRRWWLSCHSWNLGKFFRGQLVSHLHEAWHNLFQVIRKVSSLFFWFRRKWWFCHSLKWICRPIFQSRKQYLLNCSLAWGSAWLCLAFQLLWERDRLFLCLDFGIWLKEYPPIQEKWLKRGGFEFCPCLFFANWSPKR